MIFKESQLQVIFRHTNNLSSSSSCAASTDIPDPLSPLLPSPIFALLYVEVHRRTSLMSSSLLLQQCPACLPPIMKTIQVR